MNVVSLRVLVSGHLALRDWSYVTEIKVFYFLIKFENGLLDVVVLCRVKVRWFSESILARLKMYGNR